MSLENWWKLRSQMEPRARRRSGLRSGWPVVCLTLLVLRSVAPVFSAENTFVTEAVPLLDEFCFGCHGERDPDAHLSLAKLAGRPDFASDFRAWRKVLDKLERHQMPPSGEDQPSDTERRQLIDSVRTSLRQSAERHAEDPGPVVLRRLTAAEYGYTIKDLTGLDLDLDRGFVSDAAGGEGFVNVGLVQFMQETTLERYLEAARQVAQHAMIGSGPLLFFQDPGNTGFELSAIARIRAIYRAHGFQSGSGEGGEAFGLDLYPRSLYTAWRYRHREKLGLGSATLADIALTEGVSARFAEYIHAAVTAGTSSFPTAKILAQWHGLPVPDDGDPATQRRAREQCDRIHQLVQRWQTRFGQNPFAKEESPVLAGDSFDVQRTRSFEMSVNWPEGTTHAQLRIRVAPASGDGNPRAVIIWREPTIQFNTLDLRRQPPVPLKSVVSADDVARLRFGEHTGGGNVAAQDFVTVGTAEDTTFEIPVPRGTTFARLTVTSELDVEHGDDCFVRITIAQREETDQGKQVSGLLANQDSPKFASWKKDVLEFARIFPQFSQREPTPSDRDPIPAPFDSSYSNLERDYFHYKVKYHRDDDFLVENVLDDATRKRLGDAWNDLQGSFEYHDAYLGFIAEKFELDFEGRGIEALSIAEIETLASEPRKLIGGLHRSFGAVQAALLAAEAGHIADVVQFASRAWRRPVENSEADRLRAFYTQLRQEPEVDHREAVRTLLTRVLVAPEFLYRAEGGLTTSDSEHSDSAIVLSDWELASRLSYFLWSSLPDPELRRAAAVGELRDPDALVRHARRMLRDPKARRMATEFFGQWFGFYQFDRYRGVDPERFSEFTESLQAAMHDEAVSFFEYIVRHDRPVSEILFADYTFLNRELAAHFGVESNQLVSDQHERVTDVRSAHRGGLLGLGAVLTVTSAPLRTSPVKRGDWILRRVLGTPVPPPPADAGSIPADDVLGDGLTVRQRLEAHRQQSSCRNCHARIDPFGFALEHYDAIGRWRDAYRDGQPIETSGTLRDGTLIQGTAGLRTYLRDNVDQFHRTLATKLVGYSMGRGESIADALLIDRMIEAARGGARFSSLVERVVTSRQFRYRRSTREGKEQE